ncbi:unnamed protein product, partial [Allacma fusca]
MLNMETTAGKIFFIALIVFVQSTISENTGARSTRVKDEVSKTLEELFRNHDGRLRPNFGGPPVKVAVSIHIEALSAVSEANMDFTTSIFFHEKWYDPRLAYKEIEGISKIALKLDEGRKLWAPDTYFPKQKHAFVHSSPNLNQACLIFPDG